GLYPRRKIDGLVAAVGCNERGRKRGFPAAEAAVHLLQGHDIGVDFPQNPEDSPGIAPPVGTDRLADIVAGNDDHEARISAPRTRKNASIESPDLSRPERTRIVLGKMALIMAFGIEPDTCGNGNARQRFAR